MAVNATSGSSGAFTHVYDRGRLSKLAANFSKQIQYVSPSWNIFRYIGDYLHLFGIVACLATVAKNRSCAGFSRSTQILYLFVFVSRYLDLLEHAQTTYLVVFKITYILTSIIILALFYKLDKTYERQKDTCSMSVIVIPCLTAAILLAYETTGMDILWSFSQFLEGFAMVPQYIFCYRDRTARDPGVIVYVLSLGGYRVFYAANWIYKKVMMPHYSDVHSWVGGIIEISFFMDYLLSRCAGCSLLSAFVLGVDEKINAIKEKVGLQVLGKPSAIREVTDGECELRHRRKAPGDEETAASEV